MAWKPEVLVGGKWCRNGLVFATEQEARDSARELAMRWFAVQDDRAVEVVGEPVTHSYAGRVLQALDTAPKTVPAIVADTPAPASLWPGRLAPTKRETRT